MPAPKNISELLERWGLKEPGPSEVELELQRRRAQDRAAKEAEFAASEEGRQQAEYDRSLAYAKAPHYAPLDQLSAEDKRLVLQDQADARQRALAKELGITLGKPRKLSGGSTTGKTEIRKPTAAEERASEKGIGYTGDLTTAPFGQMDLGAEMMAARPTLPAEIVAYPASVAGGVYDLVVQAMDDNPNLTPAQRRTGAVLAAAAFIPGGKAAKAADEAAEAAAEAAKAGTKGAKEGVEKVAKEGAEEISDVTLTVLRKGQGDEVLRALEELGYSPSQARLRVESGEGMPDMPILADPQKLRVRQSYIDRNLDEIAKRRAQAESSPAAARQAAETTATAK